jgi:hypothetical protein
MSRASGCSIADGTGQSASASLSGSPWAGVNAVVGESPAIDASPLPQAVKVAASEIAAAVANRHIILLIPSLLRNRA